MRTMSIPSFPDRVEIADELFLELRIGGSLRVGADAEVVDRLD